jgi:diguanylate cyclase (GGDEF)-like protein
MDIDYFKRVNDTYGHHVGDQLLKHVVKVCQTQLKESMIFARYGGDEFVLALKGHTVLAGEEVANQLRRTIEANPLITDEEVISVTLSSGVAGTSNDTDETLYLLLNKVDKALYSAKREGRNRVKILKVSLIIKMKISAIKGKVAFLFKR